MGVCKATHCPRSAIAIPALPTSGVDMRDDSTGFGGSCSSGPRSSSLKRGNILVRSRQASKDGRSAFPQACTSAPCPRSLCDPDEPSLVLLSGKSKGCDLCATFAEELSVTCWTVPWSTDEARDPDLEPMSSPPANESEERPGIRRCVLSASTSPLRGRCSKELLDGGVSTAALLELALGPTTSPLTSPASHTPPSLSESASRRRCCSILRSRRASAAASCRARRCSASCCSRTSPGGVPFRVSGAASEDGRPATPWKPSLPASWSNSRIFCCNALRSRLASAAASCSACRC
mmetsp:Transcript_69759/g.204168  ORF Transcript_69759/g.204168 Transcript_69759/m.204168 type:complete len:292 (+) Transcript_69759:219-1094(+)